jgi:hypothetical protein
MYEQNNMIVSLKPRRLYPIGLPDVCVCFPCLFPVRFARIRDFGFGDSQACSDQHCRQGARHAFAAGEPAHRARAAGAARGPSAARGALVRGGPCGARPPPRQSHKAALEEAARKLPCKHVCRTSCRAIGACCRACGASCRANGARGAQKAVKKQRQSQPNRSLPAIKEPPHASIHAEHGAACFPCRIKECAAKGGRSTTISSVWWDSAGSSIDPVQAETSSQWQQKKIEF